MKFRTDRVELLLLLVGVVFGSGCTKESPMLMPKLQPVLSGEEQQKNIPPTTANVGAPAAGRRDIPAGRPAVFPAGTPIEGNAAVGTYFASNQSKRSPGPVYPNVVLPPSPKAKLTNDGSDGKGRDGGMTRFGPPGSTN